MASDRESVNVQGNESVHKIANPRSRTVLRAAELGPILHKAPSAGFAQIPGLYPCHDGPLNFAAEEDREKRETRQILGEPFFH